MKTQTNSPPTSEEIDDRISAWHACEGNGIKLHQALGWTWDEFALWVRDDSIIPSRPLPEFPLTSNHKA
jgi:hypothetical protein